MIPQIATPISHQFENKNYGKEISAVSDCLEVRERSLNSELKNQHLFHIDIDLTHKWDDELRDYLKKAFDIKPNLKLITLQATRCCRGEKIVDNMFQLDGKIYDAAQMLNNSIENTKWLQKIIGDNVLIGLENNNYYPSPAYDIVADGDFITQIINNNNLFLLLDIAHAMVTAHNKKINYFQYIETLPLDKLIQLHICQPKLPVGGIARDTHNEPNHEMFLEVIRLINKYPTIKYLTIEYYRDKDILISSINKLRQLISSTS
jgi:sugar phosphate isomerase/epimerase